MQAISIVAGVTPTLVAAAGNRDFLHVFNNSDVTMYLSYDIDVATVAGVSLVLKGMPLLPGQVLQLVNDGHRNVFNKPVYAIHEDLADKEIRIQGA